MRETIGITSPCSIRASHVRLNCAPLFSPFLFSCPPVSVVELFLSSLNTSQPGLFKSIDWPASVPSVGHWLRSASGVAQLAIMKLLSWMHRKFQGSRVNPCKEVPATSTFEGWESESLEESKAVAAHYFLIRRKNSDEPWIPLKITSPGDQLTTAEPVREKTQNLPVYPKTTKLFGSISNCFQAAGIADDEGAATLTSLVHDQLGLLAIGTFGLREFADGELGDLEGFEMFVGTSESDLRSRLNIPEPADNVCLPGSSEKQVLEIGEGVCAQGCKRNSPVFGEGDLQVFGGYCWELRGAYNVCEGGVEGDGTATCLKDPATGESTEKAKVEVDVATTVQKERKKMLSMQTFLDSYNSGLPPSLRTRSSEDKFLHRIAKFLGGKTQRSRRQLPGLECANDRRDSEVHEEKGKHEDAKIANARSLAQRLFRLRSKSSSWIKPLTRVREPSCHVTKKALQQGKTGEGAQEENVICTDVAFTCGPHPPRRKRSGKPQLRDLFEQPREDRSTDDLLPKSSQEVCTEMLQSRGHTKAPSAPVSRDPFDQALDRIYAPESHFIIEWASDGDDEFVSQSSDEGEFELNQEQWLKSDLEYFVLEL